MAKKAFALRIDEHMLSALQRWADDEFRSVNGQIEYLLHDALRKAGRVKQVARSSTAESDSNKDDSDSDPG